MNKNISNPRILAPKIILEAKKNNQQISIALKKYTSQSKISNKDKQVTTNLVNGTIRMSKRLFFEINNVLKGNINSLPDELLEILKVGVYQIIFNKSTPDYAAVNSTVESVKLYNPKFASLANAILRNVIRKNKNHNLVDTTSVNFLSNFYSHPRWLIRKWMDYLVNDDLINLLKWNNANPLIWFRVCSNDNLDEILLFINENHGKYIDILSDIFVSHPSSSIILNSKFFTNGYLTVQNPTNGLIVSLLNPKHSDKIIDACAAPGGKAAQIMSKLSNDNKLLTYDINEIRGKLLRGTLNRLNLTNYTFSLSDVSQCKLPIVNKIICDVPCSGTGTMSKRSDLRWRLKMNNIMEHQENQFNILNNVSKYIKPDGVLVYSTCSLEPEENWDVVNKFLKTNSNYTIQNAADYIDDKFVDEKGALSILPHKHSFEGGFAVRFLKNA